MYLTMLTDYYTTQPIQLYKQNYLPVPRQKNKIQSFQILCNLHLIVPVNYLMKYIDQVFPVMSVHLKKVFHSMIYIQFHPMSNNHNLLQSLVL